MKTLAPLLVLLVSLTSLTAAPLNLVDVGPDIACVFNTNCTNFAQETSTPIFLPNSSGSGFLQTRVIQGRNGSLAAGLYTYQYRIDLSGITASNTQPCFTNVVRCSTNRVPVVTNALVCKTNLVGPFIRLTCVTNRLPATNFVFCFTNSLPERDVITCTRNDQGVRICVTNTLAATNLVFCFTNKFPARNMLVCETNIIPATNRVVCSTNRVTFFSNIVQCVTNLLPCPGQTPCITELRVNFGPLVGNLDFDGDGSLMDQAYVITTGGDGTVAPVAAERDGDHVVFHFAPALCAGQASVAVGLVSKRAPRNSHAQASLNTGASLILGVRAPREGRAAVNCDFRELLQAIKSLTGREILAQNAQVRDARRQELELCVLRASEAAEAGDLDTLLEELGPVLSQMDGEGKDWLSDRGVRELREIILSLLRCLEDHHDRGGDSDDDHPKKGGPNQGPSSGSFK